MICKNKYVPKKANKKATKDLVNIDPAGKNSMATNIPKRALSMVPAVVGETNLF